MKPQPKREVAIGSYNEVVRFISLYATKDAIEDIKEFGQVRERNTKDSYELYVDSRYDFSEVLEYIKNYG